MERHRAIAAIHSKSILKLRKAHAARTRPHPQVGKPKTLLELLVLAASPESEGYQTLTANQPISQPWKVESGIRHLLKVGIFGFIVSTCLYLIYFHEFDIELVSLALLLAGLLYIVIINRILDAQFDHWLHSSLAGQQELEKEFICLACYHTWQKPVRRKRQTKRPNRH